MPIFLRHWGCDPLDTRPARPAFPRRPGRPNRSTAHQYQRANAAAL